MSKSQTKALTLVPSSPDNVDFDRLKKDIPKFFENSRVISTEQKQWWDTFFKNVTKTYNVSPKKPVLWLLDEVQHLKSLSTQLPSQPSTSLLHCNGLMPSAQTNSSALGTKGNGLLYSTSTLVM